VLQQHCGLAFHQYDVFASTVGGAKLTDPGSDLALAIALASAHMGSPPPAGVVAMGEIGLSGELRPVRDVEQRIAEASRLGFSVAIVPATGSDRRTVKERRVDNMRVIEAPDLLQTLAGLRMERHSRDGHQVVQEAERALRDL